jgi:hypothetical protein
MAKQVWRACKRPAGLRSPLPPLQFIEGGVSECVMALGFEKMEVRSNEPVRALLQHRPTAAWCAPQKGSLGSKFQDRTKCAALRLAYLLTALTHPGPRVCAAPWTSTSAS